MMYRVLSFITALLFLMGCSGPRALFEADSGDQTVPAEVQFSNKSEKADTYLWDFGDGSQSTEESPDHQYLRSGTHTVSLTAIKGKKTNTKNMDLEFDAPAGCLVLITTDYGQMLVKLYDETPQHRDNFLKLAEEGYYDGLLFHRVIGGFMVQGGDPDSRNADPGKPLGMGGPGYQVPAEFNENLVHVKGALAAARMGDNVNPEQKSSGSQFYIVQGGPVDGETLDVLEIRNGMTYSPQQREEYATLGGTPHLDMGYTVFGRIIDGLDVIDKIAAVQTDPRNRPVEDIRMKVEIVK